MMREREREMWFEVEEKKVGGCAVGREKREERKRKTFILSDLVRKKEKGKREISEVARS